MNKPIYLLVEPNNTGVGSNFVSLDKNTKDSIETCSGSSVARKLKIPLLMPVFPRPGGTLYTHALDRETLLIGEGDLKRIDLQLIAMIAHAQKLLRHNDVKVNEKIFMNGFSASGTFTNRFTICTRRLFEQSRRVASIAFQPSRRIVGMMLRCVTQSELRT